jgi:hypothetical protein
MGGDGSAVHAGKSNELAVGIGDGDHYGFFGLGSFFEDHVDDSFGGVVDDGEIPHSIGAHSDKWGERLCTNCLPAKGQLRNH